MGVAGQMGWVVGLYDMGPYCKFKFDNVVSLFICWWPAGWIRVGGTCGVSCVCLGHLIEPWGILKY